METEIGMAVRIGIYIGRRVSAGRIQAKFDVSAVNRGTSAVIHPRKYGPFQTPKQGGS
jgi:hypothetical protein